MLIMAESLKIQIQQQFQLLLAFNTKKRSIIKCVPSHLIMHGNRIRANYIRYLILRHCTRMSSRMPPTWKARPYAAANSNGDHDSQRPASNYPTAILAGWGSLRIDSVVGESIRLLLRQPDTVSSNAEVPKLAQPTSMLNFKEIKNTYFANWFDVMWTKIRPPARKVPDPK